MPDVMIDRFLPPNGIFDTGADMGEALAPFNSRLAGFVSSLRRLRLLCASQHGGAR